MPAFNTQLILVLLLSLSGCQANPTRGVNLLLRTGQFLDGDIIGFNKGVVLFRDANGEHSLPLGWFMPTSQQYIRQHKDAIILPESLPVGPYSFEPKPLDTFAALRQAKLESESYTIVFVDPSGQLVDTLKRLLPRLDRLRSALSFIRTYSVGPSADPQQALLMARQYKFEFPGILILKKNEATEALSKVMEPTRISRALAPLATENAAYLQALETSAEEIEKSAPKP